MKSLLIFSLGTAFGAVAGVFLTRGYFDKKYREMEEKHIKEMEEYYGKTDSYARSYGGEGSGMDGDDSSGGAERETIEEEGGAAPSKEARLLARGEKREPVSYHKMFQEDDAEESEEMTPEEEEDEWHEKHRNQPPEIISVEAAGEVPSFFEHEVLYFYTEDESVTDDCDNYIEEPKRILGDCLECQDNGYDFIDSEDMLLFVCNFELNTVYEIQKVHGSFSDEM